ncbi:MULTISPECIES: hypothetical protein [Nocardia]|uniref:hypothetical protein n=1 Tax=Nocardia TaxID=1817 RepID=UPI001300B7F5|nr:MULTISPECIES: hypothetical protein [Nocardia]
MCGTTNVRTDGTALTEELADVERTSKERAEALDQAMVAPDADDFDRPTGWRTTGTEADALSGEAPGSVQQLHR